jgi:hypothetical protein
LEELPTAASDGHGFQQWLRAEVAAAGGGSFE